jgi:hypothetical protein
MEFLNSSNYLDSMQSILTDVRKWTYFLESSYGNYNKGEMK